jgi:hypothetical protein
MGGWGCALCGRSGERNVYYCSKHDWHLCRDCGRRDSPRGCRVRSEGWMSGASIEGL